jgi:DeoR family fructose operon transcriptional repressor
MLAAERYELILEHLGKYKVVKVSKFSSLIGVTEKTIRIDLEHLEQRGLLKRIHGGAVQINYEIDMFPVSERQAGLSDIKLTIAKEALKLIKPHETILLDGGSTTLALAKLIGDFPVTVITNDIKIANLLLEKSNVQLMVLGGIRIANSSSLLGDHALEALGKIRVSRLFFGTTGVSSEFGLTVLNSLHADWKRKIIERAEKVTLLADSTKFERAALIQFASLVDVDEVVTDSNLNKEILNSYIKNGIQLIVAKVD